VRVTLATLAAVALTAPLAVAYDFPRLGIFRKKKEDPPAAQQQPQQQPPQAETLRADPDEAKRKAAATELAEFDPRREPDLIPALTGSLGKDPSPAVRAEVAAVLGKIKPVTQQGGVALEQTLGNDPSADVRKAAQQALWEYHLNGYRSAGANPAYPQTGEPPLAQAKPPATAEEPEKPKLDVPPLPKPDGKPPAVPTFTPPPTAAPAVSVPTFTPPTAPTPPPAGGFTPPPAPGK
jgi:hypothetical protein